MFSRLLATALILSSGLSLAQQPVRVRATTVPRVPLVLRASTSMPISAMPFSYFGEPICDANGSLYFHRDTGIPGSINILHISPSGEEDGGVNVTGELAEKYMFISFAVAPSGTIHVLGESAESYGVLSFGADGSLRDTVELETPKGLNLEDFAVFDDGAILVSGYFGALARPSLRDHTYSAIYESTGSLRVQLKTSNATAGFSRPSGGTIAIGADGNAYLLHGHTITVVSEEGRIVKHFQYGRKSDPTASRLNISGGLLAVVMNNNSENAVDRQYLVLDATTGEDLGLYTAALDLQNSDVCFSEIDGFTFLVQDSAGRLARVIAPLR